MTTKKPEDWQREEQWTPGTPMDLLRAHNVHLPVSIPLADVPPDVLAEIGTKGAAAESGDLVPLLGAPIDPMPLIRPARPDDLGQVHGWGALPDPPPPFSVTYQDETGRLLIATKPDPGVMLKIAPHPAATAHINVPYVATLPDGTRINIPAGTTMREGSDGQPMPVRFFDLANSLRAAFAQVDDAMFYGDVEMAHAGWEALKTEMVAQEKINAPVRVETSPDVARDLLRSARSRLVDEPESKTLDAEIAAFLVGALLPAREATHEENFAALKHMAPSLAAVHERAAAKLGCAPWDVTDEQLWEECPNLRPVQR